ncbi:hypothetical protein J6590_028749 [Homalodisca vitripennis]|nr:hypothetical protein J6590_028749 [Homalodisca vitripennis]
MDETYFHSSSAVSKTWTESETKGLKNPISKGKRVIVLHAGSEDGFVPNALVMFESGKKTAKEKFDSITKDEWKTRCEHVKKVEEEYLRHERIIDDVTERCIINLGKTMKVRSVSMIAKKVMPIAPAVSKNKSLMTTAWLGLLL